MTVGSNQRIIRIGVLGAANIAMRSVIPAIRNLSENFELVAVASRDIQRHQSLENIPLIDGYEALLQMENLDAVYIPLPNSLHYEWVKKALERGLHVLVEKSMACTLEEVTELNAIAKQRELALVENFQFRFHHQMEYLNSVLQSGILGDLRIVRSTFCFPPFPDASNIRYQPLLGGGALLDAGAYPIKMAQLILGYDIQVDAASLNGTKEYEVDIWGGAQLKQKNGNCFAQIAFGFDHFYQCNVELTGTKGKLSTNRIFTANEKVEPVFRFETAHEGVREITLPIDNHFQKMLLHFYTQCVGSSERNDEYTANVHQARLIHELKEKANEQ